MSAFHMKKRKIVSNFAGTGLCYTKQPKFYLHLFASVLFGVKMFYIVYIAQNKIQTCWHWVHFSSPYKPTKELKYQKNVVWQTGFILCKF